MTAFRYSELTPAMVSVLRVYRAVEGAYPQDGDRATRTLAGYEDWRRKRVGGHLRSSVTNPGIDHRNIEQNQGPSRANSSGSRPLRGVKSESHNNSGKAD